MQNLFLKPAADAAGNAMLVRDPSGWKPLDTAGEWKAATAYWLCRVQDGDAVDCTAAKQAEIDAAKRIAEVGETRTLIDDADLDRDESDEIAIVGRAKRKPSASAG